jgi:hypothetical protein
MLWALDEVAVQEALLTTLRRVMDFDLAIDQLETVSKGCGKTFRAIANSF